MPPRHLTTLDHILGSRHRVRLLTALLMEPGRRPYLRELMRESGASWSFTRTQLDELERMGLVRKRMRGGPMFYEVTCCHPLYQPLRDLIRAAQRVDEGAGRRPRPWMGKDDPSQPWP